MTDASIATLAALLTGDCWLSADACAVFLGLTTKKGEPNRRGFLERVACRSSFPKPLIIGNEKKWKKSEVALWAEDERRHPSAR
ncbi:hypothetical protein [Lysobacter antibioticus]|uniref:hypothetical protein n=1 Tax=Lysobacter antibioticus TaxID=84531 RepID=UPI0007E8DABB|nr:hypothetical protein [Lysobacter antibioticus]